MLQLRKDKKCQDGSIYNGQMKGSKRHGYGAQVYENGLYEGYWEDDKAKGKGIFYYAEGDTYDGEWLND